jgi:hypothetical protein
MIVNCNWIKAASRAEIPNQIAVAKNQNVGDRTEIERHGDATQRYGSGLKPLDNNLLPSCNPPKTQVKHGFVVLCLSASMCSAALPRSNKNKKKV